MPLKVKTRTDNINRAFLAATLFGVATWALWPTKDSWWQADFLWAICATGTTICTVTGIVILVRDYRLRRDLAKSQEVSTDHGSAREAMPDERTARGMDNWRHGELLGIDEDGSAAFRPPNTPFAIFEMPPGVGKTSCYVIPSILHRAQLGYSILVTDPKTELAPVLVPSLRERNFEVWCINPAKKYIEIVGDTEINLKQPLLDAFYAEDDHRKDVVKHASDQAHIHYPPTKDAKQPYFEYGSRRALVVADVSNALIDPANCTPTALYSLVTDPDLFMRRLRDIVKKLETLIPNDPLVEFLKGEAKNFLHRAKKNEENFASFLEGAGQRLLSFNPAGRLGHYGCNAIHNISALRERQIIVFVMTPLSHMREFADFTSLLNYNLISACKANPEGHPVHIVAEEALNYRFHELTSDLETLRQLRVTADFYIQSFAGLTKRYGREAAEAIESYCDIRVYAGLNSLARAKHVSEMLSDTTLRKQDFSYGAEAQRIGVSSRELARPLMKPNEVLAMERNHVWAFVRGMHPMKLRMVSYAEATPWIDWVEPSPITGTRIEADPILRIDYESKRDKR